MAFIPSAITGALSQDPNFKKTQLANVAAQKAGTLAPPTPPTVSTIPQAQQYAAPVKPVTTAPTAKNLVTYDVSKDLDGLKTARNTQLVSQLEAKKQAALSALQAEEDNTKRVATENRNTTSTQSQLGAKNFAEFMAARGGSRDGANAQAELSRNVAYQGALSKIGSDEQNAIADIARRRSLAEMQAAADLASGQAGIDSELTGYKISNSQQNAQQENEYNRWLYGTQIDANKTALDDYYKGTELGINIADKNYNNQRLYNQDLRTAEQDKLAAIDRDKNNYINSISGLGNQFDYAAEIQKLQSDGDTTNDWKIPYLQKEREVKVQNNLKNDVATIGQYNNDYAAEIERRTQANPNDPLIPYLKVARAEKLAKIESSKLTAAENQQKNALEYFKQLGYATPEIASILGIPAGSKTADYIKTEVDANYKQGMLNNNTLETQYKIKKPYYNPNSGSSKKTAAEKKADITTSWNEDYSDLKKLSVGDVVNELENNSDAYVNAYGYDGYKKLWNSVLSKAIEWEQVKKK